MRRILLSLLVVAASLTLVSASLTLVPASLTLVSAGAQKSKPVQKSPRRPKELAREKPVGKAPRKPAEPARAKPIGKTPRKPAELAREKPVGKTPRKPAKPTTRPAYPPTSVYAVRGIEGWKVHVHKELLTRHKQTGDEALKLLEVKLYDIVRVVPPPALADLRKIPIWISATDRQGRHPCACYHPSAGWLKANGYNPDKAGAVDILNAATFVNWTTWSQPSMVLHELAHGYHHQFLKGGHGNQELKAAYQRMVASKKYESVLYCNGKKKRAYALNNPMEYFAELTEAFYGTNDFYPFVRAEVITHDPEAYKLLRKLWKEGRRRR